MSSVKRKLQLSGAITSICIGSLSLIGAILAAVMVFPLLAEISAVPEAAGLIIVMLLIVLITLAFGIAMIVCGAKMCVNPSNREKPTEYKGLTIALIVFAVILFLCAIYSIATGAASFITWLELICYIAIIALFIASLCVKGGVAAQPAQAAQSAQQAPAQTAEQPSAQSTQNDKIASIRKLQADGVITEEEAKNLIIKELEK